MRLSTAYRYKFLKDYRIGVPELLSEVSYSGNIIFNESDLRKSIGWLPEIVFNQLGQDIIGEAADDRSGWSVSINASGDRVAIGAIGNDGNGTSSGHTRIYQLSSSGRENTWVQLGQDIDGELAVDRAGTSVSLNHSGDIVAIGAPNNDGNGNSSGHVRVYQLSSYSGSNSWVQLGQDIDGEAVGDNSGNPMVLNGAGNIVAIAAFSNDAGGSDRGHVRVYQLSSYAGNNSWVRLGQDIDGEANLDWFGWSIDLNTLGNILVVGAPLANGGLIDRGRTKVYQLSTFGSNNSWIQLGQNIDGELTTDQSGYSVTINSLGDRIAIGAPFNNVDGVTKGHVRVFQLSSFNGNNSWVKLGEDIDGEIINGQSGYSVSMNSMGDRVAIGAMNNIPLGHTKIYQLSTYNSNNTWIKIGEDINGQVVSSFPGIKVSLNSIGDRIAIGASTASSNGNVRVIDLTSQIIDRPFTSFNDEMVSVTRPTWKYSNNLNIYGGWYDSISKEFITDTNQLNLSASSDSDKFTFNTTYKGYKWVEIATKKNTSISLSALQPSAIYFKLTGFAPSLITPPVISWTYNSNIVSGSNIYNNIFRNVVPNFITLSSPNLQDVYINYTPEIQPLSGYHRWYVGDSDKYFTKNASLTSADGATTITYFLSTYSYKNTYPVTTNSATFYTASTGFFDFANKSTNSLKSRLTSVTPLTSTINLFTVKNPSSNIFIRNPSVWCADLVDQLTGLVVYKGNPPTGASSVYSYGGTLITPRHVLYVQHAFPRRDIVRFVTSNSAVVSARPLSSTEATNYLNVSAISALESIDPYYTDIGIVLLDRDVSLSGIHVFPMAAITPTERTILIDQYIPTIHCTQAPGRGTIEPNPNPLSASDIQMVINSTNFLDMTTAWGSISTNPFYSWDTQGGGYTLWDGDSGNAHFLFCNDKLYVYSTTRFTDGRGAIVSALSGAINFLIEKVDQLAGVNTGMRPTYYTIDQIANR